MVTTLSIHDRQMKMQAEILGLYTTVSFQAKKNDSSLYKGGSSESTEDSTKMRTDD